ncbi:hypothetical protein, partial [Micromonospora sp. CB01531]|uniref:hypothetical protein n=1 Tax=Micromonospora sp. CB01531 TaxID=1718947 RepID=UPI001300E1E8
LMLILWHLTTPQIGPQGILAKPEFAAADACRCLVGDAALPAGTAGGSDRRIRPVPRQRIEILMELFAG